MVYVRAFLIQECLFGSKTPEVATTLENFAKLLRDMSRIETAREMESRAKRIRGELAYTRSVTELQRW